MDVRFIASYAVISRDPAADRRLFVDALGLPLHPADEADPDGYWYAESLEGAKHFGVWPLAEAAQACFGQDEWPQTHPVPQASVEFEVDDVAAAAEELAAAGHQLIHPSRTEPWGQTVARLQSPDGVIVGVCFTPSMREG